MQYHVPVLLQEVSQFLDVQPQELYIDATLGGGGHTQAIISAGGKVLGLDQDADAIAATPDHPQLTKVKANFIHLAECAKEQGWIPASGVLFDLGIASHHIDDASRGFSFQREGPLDMRMDRDLPNTAATLVNSLSEKDLGRILFQFGELINANQLSRKIVAARPVITTCQLAKVVGNPDSVRRVFQALRIAVNDELGAITAALPQAFGVLRPGGRIVVISFHSLEDRIIKDQFNNWQNTGLGEVLTVSPVIASVAEVSRNSRSASAKLRAFKKK